MASAGAGGGRWIDAVAMVLMRRGAVFQTLQRHDAEGGATVGVEPLHRDRIEILVAAYFDDRAAARIGRQSSHVADVLAISVCDQRSYRQRAEGGGRITRA